MGSMYKNEYRLRQIWQNNDLKESWHHANTDSEIKYTEAANEEFENTEKSKVWKVRDADIKLDDRWLLWIALTLEGYEIYVVNQMEQKYLILLQSWSSVIENITARKHQFRN